MTLTILIMLISIGYAALNQNLNISGEAFLRVQESVRITRIELSDATNEGYETYTPEYSKKGVKVYSTLPSINSKVTYNAKITNTTGAKYMVDSIEVTNTNTNIECTSSITKGSIIENGISDFTVEVKYKSGVELNEEITDVCNIKYEFVPLDLMPPTLDAQVVSKSNLTATFKITAQDEEGGSGLSDTNKYQYCFSNNTSGENCTWKNYTSGTSFSETASSAGTYYLFVYAISDNAGNVSDGKESNNVYYRKIRVSLYNKVENFGYTGSEQTFVAPVTGYYRLETWGAQGGSSILDGGTRAEITNKACVQDGTGKCAGGNGAYTQGIIYLNKDETLHLYVGGKGATGVVNGTAQGGYNGGGSGDYDHNDDEANGAGGGATDIRLVGGEWNNDTSLNSRIMVAAGGGGSSDTFSGLPGGDLRSSDTNAVGSTKTDIKYATQTEGYKFGIGQDGIYVRQNYPLSGAGGGYYGGFSTDDGSTFDNRGSGGSSFISGFSGVDAITSASDRTHTANTIHYSGKYFINATMSVGVNSGNGKAKITYISKDKPKRVNTKLDGVRYIKDCMHGNTVNDSDHWVELQAIYQGKNIAKGKTVTATSDVLTAWGTGTLTSIVDGDIDTEKYSNLYGGTCVTVDLGQAYDIDELAIWHYWKGNRIYFENKSFVSSDNTNWIEVTIPTSKETSNGRRINAYEEYVQPLKLSINPNGGKYATQENTVIYYVNSRKSIELLTPTRTGYVFSGWEVSGQGSEISGTSFTMGSEDATLTANWILAKPTYTYTGSSEFIDDGNGNWRIKFLTSGTLTFTNLGTGVNGIDVFCVGGGGGGGGGYGPSYTGGGGGGGGYTKTSKGVTANAGTAYSVTIGSGGTPSYAQQTAAGSGGTTSALGVSAAGGAGGYGGYYGGGVGGKGGSGGGSGGQMYNSIDAGVGGANGGNGTNASNGTSEGGKGQGSTTREFGESSGTLYSGGGGGAGATKNAAGGAGGGGNGAKEQTGSVKSTNGAANTGGGGGGNFYWNSGTGYGGSGIVIIRNAR